MQNNNAILLKYSSLLQLTFIFMLVNKIYVSIYCLVKPCHGKCDKNAKCVRRFLFSFKCVCKYGFYGNGYNCCKLFVENLNPSQNKYCNLQFKSFIIFGADFMTV